MKPWLLRRPLFGQYEQILQELNREDERGYTGTSKIIPGVIRAGWATNQEEGHFLEESSPSRHCTYIVCTLYVQCLLD